MGEDQDAAGPRRLDESEGGDGLAGSGGVLEPEAAGGVRDPRAAPAAGCRRRGRRRPASPGAPRPRPRRCRPRARGRSPPRRGSPPMRAASAPAAAVDAPVAVGVAVAVALRLGQQRGQRARQRVDLVGREHGAVHEMGLLLGEQPLEPEQQRELPPPLDRRLLGAGVYLAEGSVERPAPRGAGCKGVLERLAVIDEALAREQLSARDRGRTRKRGGITHRN